MLSNFPTWSIRKPENTRPDAVCKVGGAPIGWPRDWPACALCNLPMSFLGQFTGDPLAPRLASGQTLFLFTCEHDSGCDFWDPVNGANACVLIPHDELGAHPTPIPEETPVLLELWVSSWTSRDDALPRETGGFAATDPRRRPVHQGRGHALLDGQRPRLPDRSIRSDGAPDRHLGDGLRWPGSP